MFYTKNMFFLLKVTFSDLYCAVKNALQEPCKAGAQRAAAEDYAHSISISAQSGDDQRECRICSQIRQFFPVSFCTSHNFPYSSKFVSTVLIGYYGHCVICDLGYNLSWGTSRTSHNWQWQGQSNWLVLHITQTAIVCPDHWYHMPRE